MTHRTLVSAVGILSVVLTGPLLLGQSSSSLRQVQAIPMAGVKGRIDHLAFDTAHQRLFVAALGNDTVEVIDTAAGTRLRSLSGFHEPQGMAVVPDLGVAVANGGSGTLQLIDGSTFQVRWTTQVGEDADNVRFEPAMRRLFVAAVGGISIVDPANGKVVQRIAIAGHPESFQLATKEPRLFANLPGASTIVVADPSREMPVARWPTGPCGADYPMALDEETHRLFIGCRRPASVALFDATSGKHITSVPAVGDTDDLFYDTAARRLYVIGGEGIVDVFTRDGDTLRRLERVPTRDGARTGLWVQAQRRLYVAAPARGSQPAEIRVLAP